MMEHELTHMLEGGLLELSKRGFVWDYKIVSQEFGKHYVQGKYHRLKFIGLRVPRPIFILICGALM